MGEMMTLIKHIKAGSRRESFVAEITSENGKTSSYLAGLVKGEGGNPDPWLAKKLRDNARELERMRKAFGTPRAYKVALRSA